jgi:hypothetical protein
MRVLIFHARFAHLTGGEVNARDWALGFKARGHKVVIYTLEPGLLAEQVREAGIAVVTDPALLADAPDIMLGTGINDVVALLARFPDVPAIQIGQVWDHWNAYPCRLPQVVLYVAVDDLNAEMFVNEFGIPRDEVRIVHNAVDLARVAPRTSPLPSRPARALAFVKQNYPHYADAVRAACDARSIAVDFFGYAVGRPLLDPLAAIAGYDLVIGAARTSIEGAVCGAAVLVADHRGLAGLLTTANLPRFRQNNFGRELLVRPVDAESLGAEIDAYDPIDAAEVSHQLRGDASLDRALDRWEAIFAEAIDRFRCSPPAMEDRCRSLASYLSRHLPRPWEPSPRHARFAGEELVEDRLAAATAQISQLVGRVAAVERDVAAVRMAEQATVTRIAGVERDVAAVRTAEEAVGARTAEVERAIAAFRPVEEMVRRNASLIRLVRPLGAALKRLPWVRAIGDKAPTGTS